LWLEDEGQDIAEYAIVLAVILMLVVAAGTFSLQSSGNIQRTNSYFGKGLGEDSYARRRERSLHEDAGADC
jgi:hypothetical protein